MPSDQIMSQATTILPRLVVGLAVVVVIIIIIWVVRKLVSIVIALRTSTTMLEIVPPARTDRDPLATQQLFNALHGLGSARSLGRRLLGMRDTYALELVASREAGIRFLVRVPSRQVASIKQSIVAYLPDVKVRESRDYLPTSTKYYRVASYKQAHHFAFPLATHENMQSHDPVGYITTAMTKLKDGETMAFQICITPIEVRTVNRLRSKILHNEDVLSRLDKQTVMTVAPVTSGINSVLLGITDTVSGIYHGPSKTQQQAALKKHDYNQQIAQNTRPVRTLSYFEHELVESISTKLQQPLFYTEVRSFIATNIRSELSKRRTGIESALSLFTVPKYQRLKRLKVKLNSFETFKFSKRLSAQLKPRNIFSSSELSSLYHFPHSVSARTENLVKSLSKELPAPISLKGKTESDVLLGDNHYHGDTTPIGLSAAERERHLYIVGGTGNGKTTMMLYAILQDIKNGKGVAVLDPHGDLAETILHHIPEERINDVIYLNPDDLSRPIGINLLELTPGLSGDDLLREKDLITESTISVLRKVFSEDDSGGHRIEYVLRNTIQTALTMEGSTLFTIFRLLNDNKYRREAIKHLEDKDLSDFWKNELGKAGDFQKVKMVAGITAKIGRFLFSASAKRVLEQEKSTIDFSDILDSSKILVCNFSKGLLGEDTSTLFGTTVLAKLQVAALRRARIKQAERRSFYLYVDEFQNFATMSFVQMLSEARKYKLFLTMAEQSTSQQDQQRLVDIILANVGTVVCFRSGSPADERYILPLFYPYIEQGEIANLPAYNFYMRIAAVEAQEPLSGRTVVISDNPDNNVFERVVKSSRELYGSLVKPTAVQTSSKPAANQIIKKPQTTRRVAPRA